MSEDILHVPTDLYAFVLDSATLTKGNRPEANAQKFRAWADDLRQRFSQVRQDTSLRIQEQVTAIGENLHEIREELRKQHPCRQELKTRWVSLGRNYEKLVLQLQRASEKFPKALEIHQLKPRNYARNLFHFFNSLWAALLYELVFEKPTMLIIAFSFLALETVMEIVRRISPVWNDRFCNKLFGAVSRPHEEHNITAATWYTIALVIGLITMPKHAIVAGTLMLGVGDPVASIVGKKWGKRKIAGGKSLEGTLGFFLSSALTLFILFSLVTPHITLGTRILISAVIALGGALTELFTGRIEDNFSIPLAGGLFATICLALV